MYQIYKRTGVDMDRRHLELLSRSMLNQVRIEKAPEAFPFKRGEVVNYNSLSTAINKLNAKTTNIDDAEGLTLTENIHAITAGTELSQKIIEQLKREGVKEVKVTGSVQTSAIFSPMTRSLNTMEGKWISKLNHRYISTALRDAAAYNESEDIHGYSPIASYAYGSEFGYGNDGKY